MFRNDDRHWSKWASKSLAMRDKLEISRGAFPLVVRQAVMMGVPQRSRVFELINISEAVRVKTGPAAAVVRNQFDTYVDVLSKLVSG